MVVPNFKVSAKGCLVIPFSLFVFGFDSSSNAFRLSCSTFTEQDLALFSSALSVVYWITILGMIWHIGCRGPLFQKWYNFNPRTPVSCTLFLFTGIIFRILLPVSVFRLIFYLPTLHDYFDYLLLNFGIWPF